MHPIAQLVARRFVPAEEGGPSVEKAFNLIGCPGFPARIECSVVFAMHIEAEDLGRELTVQLHIAPPDGPPVEWPPYRYRIPEYEPGSISDWWANFQVGSNFNSPGLYEFRLKIDGEQAGVAFLELADRADVESMLGGGR